MPIRVRLHTHTAGIMQILELDRSEGVEWFSITSTVVSAQPANMTAFKRTHVGPVSRSTGN